MRTRATIALVAAVIAAYAVILGVKAVALLRDGSPLAVVLALAILVVPVVGVLLVVRELQFGRRCARLAAILEREGALPVDDLPRRPSGRVDRPAAEAWFDRARAEAEAAPDSWRAWFRLALAYDAAGDRPRARAAARHAIELSSSAPS
ncbi:MAG: hypothetical protein ACLGH4_03200 [Actinomycetes bacterium]